MEAHVAEVRRHGPEEGARIGLGHELAGQGREQVMARPAEHHRIPDGQGQRPQGGNEADDLADAIAVLHAAHLHGAPESAHGTRAHGATEGHLPDHACETEQRHEDEVRNEESRATQLGHAVREQPDIGHAHRAAHAGEDEARMRRPGVTPPTGRRARLLADLDGPRLFRHDVVASVRHSVLLESSTPTTIANDGTSGRGFSSAGNNDLKGPST